MAKSAVSVPPPPANLVKVRADGITLLNPLKPAVENLTIETAEDYLEADAMLARIRNARAVWKLKMEPIQGPLLRAIEANKTALAESKKAVEGANQLFNEVNEPLNQLEAHTKALMVGYKQAEARQLREADEERQKKAQALLAEAREKERQAANAKTAGMRARLAQTRADLEQKAQEIIDTKPVESMPVKGAASTSRTQEKCRVSNLMEFLHHLEDYEPKAGVYKKGIPPASLIDPAALQTALNKVFSEQPGIVKSWPGIEIYDAITIANR